MKKTLIVTLLLLLCPWKAFCQDLQQLPPFTADDRVLVFAPHPDDEAIGTAGVIMRAMKAGAKVRVACFTNGEHNEISFIIYEKRLTLRRNEFLHMGEVRRKESLAALSLLGVRPEDVFYLGYPDFGTLSIMLKYWGPQTRPYKSILTRISNVSYKDALTPGAPYKGESVLSDMHKVLEDFKPTKVFVSHPADTNMDHQALYLFLKVALWELEDRMKPEVYPYIIHVVGWPMPRGLHQDLPLTPPPGNLFDVSWKELDLTPAETQKKKEMISCYKSQLAYIPSYLYTFDRKNELFGDCPEIALKESPGEIYVWHNVVQGDENVKDRPETANQVSHLAFARKGDSFFVKIILKTAITKNLGVRILALPFSKQKSFADMPKLSITIGIRGIQIRDKQKLVEVKDALYAMRDKVIVVKLPLASLGDPDRLLCKTWARFSREFPFRAPAWRIIKFTGEQQ